MTQVIGRLQKFLPRRKVDIFGKGSWMMSSLPYYTLALLVSFGLFKGDADPFLLIAIVYSAFPVLDELFAYDERNPSKEQRKQLEDNDAYFRLALYAAIILDWVVFFKIMFSMQTFELSLYNLPFLMGLMFINSNLCSVQFAVAHQVMHKPGKFYRYLATLHMVKQYYTHFTYHHLYRHHLQVSTPSDPSTSKKGQTVYQFIVRCVIYSWKGVYDDQKNKQGKSFFNNYAVISVASSILFALGIYAFFGLQPVIVHTFIAFGSIFYLQAINYLEHYGLQRKLLPNGQYEKVTILHSWNAPHRFTNYLLFKLQRHSDHHQNSSKPYQTLVTLDESPFLPHGYNLMIIMSFFPNIWFRIMDPLVQAYSKLDVTKKQKIDPQVIQRSITETRKFLIEVSLSALLLFTLSIAQKMLAFKM